MHVVNQCPVCGNSSFAHFLSCVDYSVSRETFELVQCTSCTLVATSPRPENKELPKYYASENYISHKKNGTTLFDKVYQIARVFTLNWKLNLTKANAVSRITSILDYGCGTGHFLSRCKAAGLTVAGVEPSDKARAIALEHLGPNVVQEDLNSVTQTFDAITLWHVLEHIPDLNSALKSLRHHLKENGTMFIAVPNHLSPDATHYKAHWAGYDVPRHLWHFNKKTMETLLKKNGLTLTKVIPMKLDSYYVSMLSEQYQHLTRPMAFIRGLISGLRSNAGAKKQNQYSSLIYVARK